MYGAEKKKVHDGSRQLELGHLLSCMATNRNWFYFGTVKRPIWSSVLLVKSRKCKYRRMVLIGYLVEQIKKKSEIQGFASYMLLRTWIAQQTGATWLNFQEISNFLERQTVLCLSRPITSHLILPIQLERTSVSSWVLDSITAGMNSSTFFCPHCCSHNLTLGKNSNRPCRPL